MRTLLNFLLQSSLLGILSTAFLDLWNVGRAWLWDIPLTKYEFIGRWLLYMTDGIFVHDSIRATAPKSGELIIGWLGHYSIGILFAMMLLGFWGTEWLRRPKLIPAMIVGMITCVIPYFIMQPAMGAGMASSLTPDPNAARIKVLVSHAVFGLGLFVVGWPLSMMRR